MEMSYLAAAAQLIPTVDELTDRSLGQPDRTTYSDRECPSLAMPALRSRMALSPANAETAQRKC